jgi:hypothetical protein
VKILRVYGEDYAASSFDNLVDAGKLTAKELWDKGNGSYDDGEHNFFEYQALEFGEVDPEFLRWIWANQDYDSSKHDNFYVVE